MKIIFIVLFFVLGSFFTRAQCKETISGDFQSKEYSSPCPVFNFSFDGINAKGWVYASKSLDISLVADEILPVKETLEQQLQAYVGDEFFSKMKFKSVDISNYDSIQKFSGRYPPVDMYACKTKYFFYYYYYPNPQIKYCIGIALDDKKNIISSFNFPQKEHYLPEEAGLDYCKVMELVKKTGTKVEPIESVSFDFDPEKQKFFWWIKQKIVNPKEGENQRNEISIEAANSMQVVSYMKVILLDARGVPISRTQEIKSTPIKRNRAAL
ncbi:hypothetical protein [Flavobacterium sp. NKUCC04_CG]|uniref:hypothetical protein n=1 Tax=Flavobacterium sp. NKUCC04_CG TaxID=2842121 RepID=UPI001C5A83F6|nr:hypothetical protein [Flavobacterium sp. NKUCC04_CG]MBW3517588.1 hypothetical protein [Flavobacterium sp. NKUCC04_CG]